MKKTIFILMMALFGLGLNQALAQSPYLLPTPLECIDLDDPLNVVPGQEYTYTVNVPVPPGTKTYHWLVTQDLEFIQSGALVANPELPGSSAIIASGSPHYNTPSTGDEFNTINLTWESFTLDPDEYVFVVIYVVNDDGTCVNDNLKVYRIKPLHAFTLDIANVDVTDPENLPGDDFESCISQVQSAEYNPTLGGVVYDFGQNDIYFVVAAANFTGKYQMSVRFDPLQSPLQDATPSGSTGQLATLYQGSVWDDVVAATAGGLGLTNSDTVTFVVENSGAVGTDGLMHYIKISINHNHFEAAAGGPFPYTIQIDGILVDDDGNPLGTFEEYGDMVDLGVPPDCDFGYMEFVKEASQILTVRPQINSVVPDPADGDFEPIVGP